MKKVLLLLSMFSSGIIFSQEQEKEEFKRTFNFLLNTQVRGNYITGNRDFIGDAGATGGAFSRDLAKFSVHQLRLEAKGDLTESAFYRLRHRLSGGRVGAWTDLDNAARATDIAFIGYRFTDDFTVILGKQCIPYGGFEFDWNPVFVYEYSDMIEEMDNFMTGIDFGYKMGDQEFRFNVANTRTRSFKGQYGGRYDYDSIKASGVALLYTLNWNGSFLDGAFQTRYSVSLGEEAKGKYMYYGAFGHQLQASIVRLTLDYMVSLEQLDRKGFLLGNGADQSYGAIYGVSFANRAQNAFYNTFVFKAECRVTDNINIFVQPMVDLAFHKDKYENRVVEDGNGNSINVREHLYRTAQTNIVGVEYYPNKDENLHFFVTYINRNYFYNKELRDFGVDNMITNKFLVGAIWQIPMIQTKF